jgi:hypothetical protein
MVNNRIHKKKIQKITKIKEIEKNKFKKRLEYFLNNSGVDPKDIKGLKIRSKSKQKIEPQPKKPLKKKKSKSFLDIIKKSMMLGSSSKESISIKSTSLDQKAKDNGISKGPEMFVNYESEDNSVSSSDNEIDRKIEQMQDPRQRRKMMEERRMIDELSEVSEQNGSAKSSDTKVKLMNLSRNFTSKQKVSNIEHSLDPKFQFESQVIVQKKITKIASNKGSSRFKNDSVSSNRNTNEDRLKLSKFDGKISISKFQKCKVILV